VSRCGAVALVNVCGTVRVLASGFSAGAECWRACCLAVVMFLVLLCATVIRGVVKISLCGYLKQMRVITQSDPSGSAREK